MKLFDEFYRAAQITIGHAAVGCIVGGVMGDDVKGVAIGGVFGVMTCVGILGRRGSLLPENAPVPKGNA